MQRTRQNHLEFYQQHLIAPVHYDLSDINAHLQRRFALYTKLGLSPLTFKNVRVLEVAAGTGQNSLYLAQLLPTELVLLEPNKVAYDDIKKVYKNFSKSHTQPTIINSTLENYFPENLFDIVICENWLGTSTHEKNLLKKLSEFVTYHGILVLTTVSPIGFVPNLLRRFMSAYVAPFHKDFLERTEILLATFDAHLDTIQAMTRNKKDWVQDNMINPAYFGLCLSIPYLLQIVSNNFEIINSSPVFAEDWRWFKSFGHDSQANQHFLAEYWKKAHNFLDYRALTSINNEHANIELEQKSLELLNIVKKHEDAIISQLDASPYVNQTYDLLDSFLKLIPPQFDKAIAGLQEALSLIRTPQAITQTTVRNMKYFISLFGRETVYVSLMRVAS